MEPARWMMSACPHDTADRPERWFAFAQQLSRRTSLSVRFLLALDFPEFRKMFPELDLVYANPNDALNLLQRQGFIPLARMDGHFDEGVLVCRQDDPHDLSRVPGSRLATCVSLVITDIVVRHLAKQGVELLGEMVDRPSWSAALASLLHGEVDLAILYRDFFLSLKPETRQKLMVVAESNERTLFHVFLVAPRRQAMIRDLQQALLGFHQEEASAKVLRELGCERLVPATSEEVASFSSMRHQIFIRP
ncbi:MAG: phosphate/phosphite/phosphonate ABC transporter substrate-binding protein [Acidobacteria bacterium]|nr:phosphate/phosphite/phosphonate ABC transporter substrate-binding protein [Acidobacteriota bacterium]MDW7984762.1 PhnD/SsuA/transferrin family substrate-binding protein [Acidobacteriota bacterium]